MLQPLRLRARAASFLLVLAVAAAPSCQTPTEPDLSDDPEEVISDPDPTPVDPRVTGYHAWWTGDAWKSYDWTRLDALYFFDLIVDGDGGIGDRNGWPHAWTELIDASRNAAVPLIPVVSILDPQTFGAVFSDSAHVARLTDELLDLVASGTVGGLHLDFEIFEAVSPEVREQWTLFAEDLGVALRAKRADAEYSIFTLAEDPGEAYDEARLAAAADYLVVQGYDLHWRTADQAGPIAALQGWGNRNWGAVVGRYLAAGIPSEKLVMAIPFFGYEWPTVDGEPGSATRGEALELTYALVNTEMPSAMARATEYGKQRDAVSGSPFYTYEDSTGWYQGWFEDAESLSEKTRFIREMRLGGASAFPLAYGNAELFATLPEASAPSKRRAPLPVFRIAGD